MDQESGECEMKTYLSNAAVATLATLFRKHRHTHIHADARARVRTSCEWRIGDSLYTVHLCSHCVQLGEE